MAATSAIILRASHPWEEASNVPPFAIAAAASAAADLGRLVAAPSRRCCFICWCEDDPAAALHPRMEDRGLPPCDSADIRVRTSAANASVWGPVRQSGLSRDYVPTHNHWIGDCNNLPPTRVFRPDSSRTKLTCGLVHPLPLPEALLHGSQPATHVLAGEVKPAHTSGEAQPDCKY